MELDGAHRCDGLLRLLLPECETTDSLLTLWSLQSEFTESGIFTICPLGAGALKDEVRPL